MDNLNTQYEKLAQEIYQAINRQEGLKTIEVKHNHHIEGKSGCNHQIDVYWEFEMLGIKHRVAVECKNYSKEVSVGKVRDFWGVLYDIGNVKGVFVTTEGYQSGALKFGKFYNISMQELCVKMTELTLNINAMFELPNGEKSINKTTSTTVGDNVVKAILKDIETGKTTIYDTKGEIK